MTDWSDGALLHGSSLCVMQVPDVLIRTSNVLSEGKSFGLLRNSSEILEGRGVIATEVSGLRSPKICQWLLFP